MERKLASTGAAGNGARKAMTRIGKHTVLLAEEDDAAQFGSKAQCRSGNIEKRGKGFLSENESLQTRTIADFV